MRELFFYHLSPMNFQQAQVEAMAPLGLLKTCHDFTVHKNSTRNKNTYYTGKYQHYND